VTRPLAPGVTLTGVEFVAARRARRPRLEVAPTIADVVLGSLAVADDPVGAIARATGLPRADVREALAAGRTEADLLGAFGCVRRSA